METQNRFKPIKLRKLKTNQMIYSLKDIQAISDLPDERIVKIITEHHIRPSFEEVNTKEKYYSRAEAVKAKRCLEQTQYDDFKKQLHQKGYMNVDEICQELKDKMTQAQVNKYLSILMPPVAYQGLNRERFYRNDIVTEIYHYYKSNNRKNATSTIKANNTRYLKDRDKVATIYQFCEKHGYATDKIKMLLDKYRIHPAFIYGQTEFYYKDSLEFVRLQIVHGTAFI